jgi:hypothetical protein
MALVVADSDSAIQFAVGHFLFSRPTSGPANSRSAQVNVAAARKINPSVLKVQLQDDTSECEDDTRHRTAGGELNSIGIRKTNGKHQKIVLDAFSFFE